MKLFLRSLLVLAFVGVFGAANGQFQIGATFNGIAPLSPASISDAYKFGFGGTLIGRYAVNDNLRVGLDVGFYSHSGKVSSDLSARFIPINAVLDYSFATEGFQPYVGVGVGLTSTTTKVSLLGTSVSTTSTNFNLAPTLGFRYGLSDALDLDFNVKYNIIFGDGDSISLLPIGLGVVYKLN